MNEDKLDVIRNEIKEYRKENKEAMKKLEERLSKAEHQLFLYKTIISVLRWIGAALILIVTLRFGDLAKMWGK